MVSEEKFMLEFLQWIIGWIQVIPWLVMGASLVAALTPTPVDDGLVKKAYKPVSYTHLTLPTKA